MLDLPPARILVTICEDIWIPDGPPRAQAEAGAGIILNVNASPFHRGKARDREEMLAARARASGVPVVYLNLVGGQDELVFDGGSFVMNADGEVVYRAHAFEESMHTLALEGVATGVVPERGPIAKPDDKIARIYNALVKGTRDYVMNHGFPGVIIGLSGGIDSALVCAIACDAIGAERVRAVQMPFRYTSTMSQEDSAKQAETFGVQYDVIPIEPMYDALQRWRVSPEIGVRLEGLMTEAEIHTFKMEYDVLHALETLGHEVRPLSLTDELHPIRTAIEEFQPHARPAPHPAPQVLELPVEVHPALVDDDHPPTQLLDVPQVVGGQDHGRAALAVDVGDKGADAVLGDHV